MADPIQDDIYLWILDWLLVALKIKVVLLHRRLVLLLKEIKIVFLVDHFQIKIKLIPADFEQLAFDFVEDLD